MNLEPLRNVGFYTRDKCMVCGKSIDGFIVDLPKLPITEILIDECDGGVGFSDQKFHFCTDCGHGQLLNILDKNVLYSDIYSFRTTGSGSSDNNNKFLDFIFSVIGNTVFDSIVEVGCNDMFLLKKLENFGRSLVGIDPVLRNIESTEKILTVPAFFEDINLSDYICGKSLFITSHVIEHLDDPGLLIRTILDCNKDTTFVFQFPCLDGLIRDCRFDHIYHHHVNYFSLSSFINLLNTVGCEVIDHSFSTYWNSLLIAFKKSSNTNEVPKLLNAGTIHNNYLTFLSSMDACKCRLYAVGDDKLLGYGAGFQVPVLGYYLNTDFSFLDYIIDDNINKDNMFYPNLKVEIKYKPDYDYSDTNVLVTAMNFSRVITSKLISMNPRSIILPLNL